MNCGKYGHLISRCLIPLQKKLPFKKDYPSGANEVALSAVNLPSGAGISETSVIGSASANPPELPWSKPKRRRSRSKKRSLSSPPRIVDPLIPISQQVPLLPKPSASKKWVVRPGLNSPVPTVVIGADSGISQPPTLPKKSMRESIKDPDPNFPLPLGWAVMSTKAKKKELKKWHNRIRPPVTELQGFVDGRAGDGPSSH